MIVNIEAEEFNADTEISDDGICTLKYKFTVSEAAKDSLTLETWTIVKAADFKINKIEIKSTDFDEWQTVTTQTQSFGNLFFSLTEVGRTNYTLAFGNQLGKEQIIDIRIEASRGF